MKNIIRQNKKAALQEFIFGLQESIASTEIQNDLKDKIESLENQVNSLQQKVIQLEAKFMRLEQNSKYPLSPLESSKTIQQGNSTLKSLENDNKINQQVQESISKGVSEASQSPFKTAERSEEYNIPSASQKPNFITLGKISEEEKIEIIKLGGKYL